jgi:hypothetical protein
MEVENTPPVKVNADLELVNKAKLGDQVAFGKLMARYTGISVLYDPKDGAQP